VPRPDTNVRPKSTWKKFTRSTYHGLQLWQLQVQQYFNWLWDWNWIAT